MPLPRWSPGDELVCEDLNALARAGESALDLRVDPASGLQSVGLPSGRSIRARRPLECWVLITGGGGGGIYAGTQQLEAAAGAWVAGPRAWTTAQATLRELNLSTTVPAASTVRVRAWRDRKTWWFIYT